MANHTIVITLMDGHAVPIPRSLIAHVDDTLQYETNPPGVPFRARIEGSPFSEAPLEIADRVPRSLVVTGKFFWQCFITPPDSGEVGWFPNEEPMESGGDVDVRPRNG